MKKKFKLQDLCCANCAAKMENGTQKIPGVQNANINFMMQKLTVEADDDKFDQVMEEVVKLCKKIEPDCTIVMQEAIMTKKQKKMLTRILIAALIFVPLFAAEHMGMLELPAPFVFVLFLVPYLIVGWDILYRALRNIRNGQIFDENFLMCIATFGAFAVQEFEEAVAVMLFYQVG